MIGAIFARAFGRAGERAGGPAGGDLGSAQRGDRDAIGRLYDTHVDGLYTFVFFRVGRDSTIAEDVVQETFTRVLTRQAEYDAARGTVGAWLAVMSRNVIRDHLKSHRRSDELASAWERIDATLAQTFGAMAEQPLPGEVLARAETRDLVHMTIANLPEQYKAALTRKYVDGESLATLASELGISIDATKSLLARARRAFRETLTTLSTTFAEVTS